MANLIKDSRIRYGWRYEPVVSGRRLRFAFTNRSEKNARRIVDRIDDLIDAVVHRHPLSGDLRTWLEEVDDRLRQQFVKAGLVREKQRHSVESLTEANISAKTSSVKNRTIVSLRQTQTSLIDFFGPDRDILSVTSGDADDFRVFLLSKRTVTRRRKSGKTEEKQVPGLAAATVNRRMRNAKTIFQYALRKKFLHENPFQDQKTGQTGNPSRMFHVDTELAYQVLEALPNATWRLLFSLYSWGGLRFNEALLLSWDDIVADQNLIMVRDEKGAKHGRPVRKVPLFDEIQPYLTKVWELAPEGQTLIFEDFTQGANPNQYLRNYFLRYITRAGIEPWPRIFQNLRSTRATELSRIYASHMVRAILGHTEEVAQAGYLQPLEEDYAAIREVGSAAGRGS